MRIAHSLPCPLLHLLKMAVAPLVSQSAHCDNVLCRFPQERCYSSSDRLSVTLQSVAMALYRFAYLTC